jgi:hypothetical protein
MAPSSAITAPRFREVFVLGVPHCGSTMLGRMFDRHPAAVCVGEMALTGWAVDRSKPCSCGKSLQDCEFWRRALPVLSKDRRFHYRHLTPAAYEDVRRLFGAEVLVDLSKNIVWRMVNRVLSPWRDAPAGYILLLRDSRGVLSSELRRSKDFDDMLSKHEKWMVRLSRFVKRRAARSIVVYYEDLCAEPERELRRLCEWLNLPYDDAMLGKTDMQHHFMHSTVSPYTRSEFKIRFDERWRSELDAGTRERIESVMRKMPLLRSRYLENRGAMA